MVSHVLASTHIPINVSKKSEENSAGMKIWQSYGKSIQESVVLGIHRFMRLNVKNHPLMKPYFSKAIIA